MRVEGIARVGEDNQRTNHFILPGQRQGAYRPPIGLRGVVMPRRSPRVAQVIEDPDGLAFPYRGSCCPFAERAVGVGGKLRALKIVRALAISCYRSNELGVMIQQSYPSQLHATILNGKTADLREQFFLAGAAHDRLVAFAQGRIHARQTKNSGFGLLALGDVLHRGDEVLRRAIGPAYALDIKGCKYRRSVLADESLVQRVALRFAAHDPLELGDIGVEVIRMRHFRPGDAGHVLARITENLAQAVIELQPVLGGRRTDGDAHKGQVEKLPQQPVRVRLHLQLQGAAALAPQQQHHCAKNDEGKQGDQTDPEHQNMQRLENLIAVELGNKNPVGTHHWTERAQNLNAAIVDALNRTRVRCVDRHDGRQLRSAHGHAFGSVIVLFMAKVREADRRIAIAADEQGFSARAGGRPALDIGKQEAFGRLLHDHRAHWLQHASIRLEQRYDQVEIAMTIVGNVDFAALWAYAVQGLREQRSHLWRRLARRPQRHERFPARIDQRQGLDIHRVHHRVQTFAERALHLATGGYLQFSHLLDQVRLRHDVQSIVITVGNPVFDLFSFEIDNGLQVFVGLMLDMRSIYLDHDIPDQRHQCQQTGKSQHLPVQLSWQVFPTTNCNIRRAHRACRGVTLVGHGIAPLFEQEIQQDAGHKDEQQTLGQFDSSLHHRIVHAEC